jgi:hypothetical protein
MVGQVYFTLVYALPLYALFRMCGLSACRRRRQVWLSGAQTARIPKNSRAGKQGNKGGGLAGGYQLSSVKTEESSVK